MTDFIAKLSPLYADNVNWRSISGTVEDLVDGGYDLTIKPGDIVTKGPWVDVRAFGAKGDGTTDDTAAIQAAIDSLASGGTVLFPVGTYLCSSATTVTTDGIVLQGASPRGSILKINHAGAGIAIGDAGVAAYANDVIVTRLAFLHGDTSPESFIQVARALQPTISNCSFDNATATYHIDNRVSYGLTVHKCSFNTIAGIGVYLRKSLANSPYWTTCSTISRCNFSSLSSGPAIQDNGGSNHVFTDNIFESCVTGGILINPASLGTAATFTFSGCFWENNTGYAINITDDDSYNVKELTLFGCSFNNTVAGGFEEINIGSRTTLNIMGLYNSATNPTAGDALITGTHKHCKVNIFGGFGYQLAGDLRCFEFLNYTESTSYNPFTIWKSTRLVVSGTYAWTVSGSGTSEFYLRTAAGANPAIEPSTRVYANNLLLTEGTIGSLTASQWAWGDKDTLGYNTLYVRLADSADPDSKADGYVSGLSREFSFDDYGTVAGRFVHEARAIFTDGDTTPSVRAGNVFTFNNTNPTTVTAFRDGKNGQVIYINWSDSKTTVDFSGTTLIGNARVDFAGASTDSMICFCTGTYWYCHVQDNTP